ncbi:MAG: tRNA preQ1(34) S-adenosylmethionine ribosyltransferase-isomerase QueA [Patescibacteria group bacterium]
MAKEYLSQYDFDFSEELIAQKPTSPRDAARLMIYDRKKKRVALDTFASLEKYLPPRSVLVINETKVLPARLEVKKETGGKVELLFLKKDKNAWQVLADRKINVDQKLILNKEHSFKVMGQKESIFYLKPSFSIAKTEHILERFGKTPLPPYIKHSPLSEQKLRIEYQSVFAKTAGSVAAPTASLHLTKRLMMKIVRTHAIKRLTLHVGLGTFASVTDRQLRQGKLHRERYEIDRTTALFLNQAKREGRPIIAVGTTVLRTLESATRGKNLKKLSGETDLFIREGYRFQFVDGLITNFHVPQSSLLMLVSAFASRGVVRKLYRLAIAQKFRLFSFGDGMFIR